MLNLPLLSNSDEVKKSAPSSLISTDSKELKSAQGQVYDMLQSYINLLKPTGYVMHQQFNI